MGGQVELGLLFNQNTSYKFSKTMLYEEVKLAGGREGIGGSNGRRVIVDTELNREVQERIRHAANTTQEEEIRQELEWIGMEMEGFDDTEDLALNEQIRRRNETDENGLDMQLGLNGRSQLVP